MPETNSRILIVDDEADTCENLSDIFTDLGYTVDIAHDGKSALKLVKSTSYDIALLDLKMPGMDGLELYRHIRAVSAGTVAIVITAYASGNTAASVIDAGAWKILPKPVDFPRLLALVNEALSQPLLLVVDDDRELSDSLWELFRDCGYRVYLAHDSPEAIQVIGEHHFQVIIVDLVLPSADGSQVFEALHAVAPDTHSILITAHRDEVDQRIQQALAHGANAVCYKPFDVESMLATVSKLCASKETRS